MESYRIFNDVTNVEATYKVFGSKVSMPVAGVFFVYVIVTCVCSVIWAQGGSYLPFITVGVAGGLFMMILVFLDMRLRSYGLRNVTVQIMLLHRAARKPLSQNF